MSGIESESAFVWKFLWHILLTPLTLIQFFLKKKKFSDVFRPFGDLFVFIFEAKVTFFIIVANVLIFFVSILFFSEEFFKSLINYPFDLLNLRFHTLFTSGFLHANIGHLFGNMVGIFIFGRVVERKLGALKTFYIYFGALFISSVFTSLIDLVITGSNIGGIGASGALMGLIATAILLDPFYFSYELIIPLPIMILGWLAILGDITGVLNPTQDGIGHFAHIGGFISIAILMFFMDVDEKSKLKRGLMINVISLVVGVLLFFFFA